MIWRAAAEVVAGLCKAVSDMTTLSQQCQRVFMQCLGSVLRNNVLLDSELLVCVRCAATPMS